MYKIHIITKFNEINLEVEQMTSKVWEIIEQPYVVEVYIEKQRELDIDDNNLHKTK